MLDFLKMKHGDIDAYCATPLLACKQKHVQKALHISDDQNNRDFVGPLLGPLCQIVKILKIESHVLCMFIMKSNVKSLLTVQHTCLLRSSVMLQHKAEHKIKSPVSLQSMGKKHISSVHLVSVMIGGDT